MLANVQIPAAEIVDFCQRHHIRKLSLFGSVLRDDFTPQSDIDVLVEFEPDYIPDFFSFSDMQDELADVIGREVDLNTPKALSRYFRDDIMTNAQVIYEQK